MSVVRYGMDKIVLALCFTGLIALPGSVLAQAEPAEEQAQTELATDAVEDQVESLNSVAGTDVEAVAEELAEEVVAEVNSVSPEITTEDPQIVELVADDAAPAEAPRRSVRRLGIDQTEEFSLDLSAPIVLAPTAAEIETPDVTLPNAEQDSQLQDVLVRLALDPADAVALTERNAILADVVTQANQALAAGQLGLARRLSTAVATVNSEQAGLNGVTAGIAAQVATNQALSEAVADVEAGRLFGPDSGNAFSRYTAMLADNPENQAAAEGMDSLLNKAIAIAKEEAVAGNYEAALQLLNQAEAIPNSSAVVASARTEVGALLTDVLTGLDAGTVAAIDNGDFAKAETAITQLVALGHSNAEVESLRVRLADARLYGGFKPGQQIAEAFTAGRTGQAPNMIVVPAGEFLMGSAPGDENAVKNEQPQRRVSILRGFAIAQHEVSVAQFRSFVDATGYRTDAENAGKSRVYDEKTGTLIEKEGVNWRDDFYGDNADADLPVIHVSWNDATAYAAWLSEGTARTYRLPTEAEFEYVQRSGSQTAYWWGDGAPDNVVANLTGDRDKSESRRRWTGGFGRYGDGYWGPAPVMSFVSNPFGVYDMGGNVSEWVEDCWHSTYAQAPADSSAWVNPGCSRRVIRGASWSSDPAQARTAARLSAGAASRFSRVGFRVVREL